MDVVVSLSDRQQRLLAAVEERNANPNAKIRDLCKKFDVGNGTLRRACRLEPTPEALLRASSGRGRKPRFTQEEETLISQAALEFHNNGTPISRECLKDLAQTFIKTLPAERRKSFGFKNDRPGNDWLNRFLKRSGRLLLRSVQIWSMTV